MYVRTYVIICIHFTPVSGLWVSSDYFEQSLYKVHQHNHQTRQIRLSGQIRTNYVHSRADDYSSLNGFVVYGHLKR